MDRVGTVLLLLLLAPAVLSSPHGMKLGAQTLRSQFLSHEEVKRTVNSIENGNPEIAEIMLTEERSVDGETTLMLKSSKREIEMKLQPSHRLIQPGATVRVFDGDNQIRELPFHPSVRSAFYNGKVAGSSGLASLMRTTDGWSGLVLTGTERFVLHGIQGSDRSLLIPMTEEAEAIHGEAIETEALARETVFNMTGDESFTRSVESEFTLEIGVHTDADLYKYVQQKYPKDNTELKVQEITLIILNTVHTFYQLPSIGNRIAVVVSQMNVYTTDPAGIGKTWDMSRYLDNYCEWDAKNANPMGKNYDLGLLFIGEDISGQTAGMAPVSRTCLFNRKRSCAIGEGRGFSSGIIMAHEIGHNLGMSHDGSGNGCRSQGNIMGPMVSAGATSFSSCSADYLRKYLKSLDDFGANCMRDEGNSVMEHSVAGQLPGERLATGEQCRLALGDGWTEYITKDDFCKTMWCKQGYSYQAPSSGPPMPGTPCSEDRSKICWDGSCLDKSYVTGILNNYRPTNSGSKGTARPLDELCRTYESQYPEPVTYETSKGMWDTSDICSSGMLCKYGTSSMRLAYPAPPGTSCAKGKVCKDWACVSSDGSDTNTGGNTNTGDNTNTGIDTKTGGSSGSGLDAFCKEYYGDNSAEGMDSDGCSKVKCSLGSSWYYNIPVFGHNTCTSGQICKENSCSNDDSSEVKGTLPSSMVSNAEQVCRDKMGSTFKPFCTRENILMYPNYAYYCTDYLCSYTTCVSNSNANGWSLQPVASPSYAKC